MNKIRIYIADDHALLRDGLKLIISQNDDFEVVGEADNGKTAHDEIKILKPDLAILDISMPVLTGLEAARLLKKDNPEIKIILLSRHDNDLYIEQALKININGYILKDYAGVELIRGIREVLAGNLFLSPRLVKDGSGRLIQFKNKLMRYNKIEKELLTSREKQVLKLICEGKTNIETAEFLNISFKTVQVHRQNIMRKLDLHNIASLMMYAVKTGLVEV